MSTWNDDVRTLHERMNEAQSVTQAVGDIQQLMSGHRAELSDITGSYRFVPKGENAIGVRITQGEVSALGADEVADVTVSGDGSAMLGVLRGTVNPIKAILTGKLKVRGNFALIKRLADKL